MSSQSFLNRFQSKISTVTASGNFQHIESGQQQVRVGAPKAKKKLAARRAPPPPPQKSTNQEESRSRTTDTINETKADKLAFSKKARPVNYKPYKLSDYKRENKETYFELGKLQPDLNDDELVAKRANKERVKAFSQNLREINRQQQKPCVAKTKSPREPEQVAASPSAREKALAFAKRVPKPKAIGRTSVAQGAPAKTDKTKKMPTRSNGGATASKQAPITDLEILESKHRSIQSKVDAIRKDLAM